MKVIRSELTNNNGIKMPRLIRKYEKDRVYFISNRTAEGLPFVPCLLINSFIYGILARATCLQPNVRICHFLFMGNHYHMVAVLKGDPDALKSFMEYFDGELAKFINRFRGRTNRNVWASTYDAETILTYDSALEKISYLYLNPITAGLVSSMKEYQGASSWRFFTKGISRSYRFLGSAGLSRLPYGGITKQVSCEILRKQHKNTNFQEKHELLTDPYAWKNSFPEGKEKSEEKVKKEIIERVELGEEKIRKQRNGLPVIGAHNLSKQCFHKHYISKKYGKRSICISNCADVRSAFVEEYRDFVRLCRAAWEEYKITRSPVIWPPGAFPPARLVFASVLVL